MNAGNHPSLEPPDRSGRDKQTTWCIAMAMAIAIAATLTPCSVPAATCAMNTSVGASSTCGSVSIVGAADFADIFGIAAQPDFNKGPEGGTAVTVAGASGVTAIGTASAQAGVLRLTAESNYLNSDRQGFIKTRVHATFSDTGPIKSTKLAMGTLVRATATVTIEGTASRNAGILSSALLVASDLNNNILFGLPPSGTASFDVRVGEKVTLFLGLAIFADASFTTPTAAADFGNTARFFLDFADSDVTFDALSQHDYRTVIATPVPGALLLFASSLGTLGLAASRRSRRPYPH